MALAPFLISTCFLLGLLVLSGLVRLLHFVGLEAFILPVFGVGILAVFPLGFLVTVHIGRRMLNGRVGEHTP
jgi:hypothetical protein